MIPSRGIPPQRTLTPAAQPTLDDLQRRLAALEAVIRVSGGDVAITVPGNLSITVGGNVTLAVARDYVVDVQLNHSLTVARTLTVQVNGHSNLTHRQNYSMTAGHYGLTVGGTSNTRVGSQCTNEVGGRHVVIAGTDLRLIAGRDFTANKALTIVP